MPSVALRHSQIAFELDGREGDPLVLVHGSWVDRRTWSGIVPSLAGSLSVMTYDRRGHGESTGDPRTHALRDDAEDLAELLVATDHYPAHIVAHSYGGCVALRVAGERPELIRSLVIHEAPCLGLLEDDPGSADEAAVLRGYVRDLKAAISAGEVERAAREFVGTFAQDPTAWDRLAPEWKATFRANAPRWLEEFSDPEVDRPDLAALAEFVSPVLLTEGAESPRFLHRMTEALSGHLKNGYVRVLPGVGHFPHLTQPATYIGMLLRFLVERDVPAM